LFVAGGIAEAVAQALAVANGKDVLVAGGVSVARQALDAGLADEVVLHVVLKLAGRGVRLFDTARVDLRRTEVIQGEGAVHQRCQVQ
jgi:dihydrofolate reductase